MPRCNALKNGHFPKEGLSSLLEGEWDVAESQRDMTKPQNEAKLACQGAMSWKTGIFLRGRVEQLPDGEWAAAETQREVTQDKVKFVSQGATPSKTAIY